MSVRVQPKSGAAAWSSPAPALAAARSAPALPALDFGALFEGSDGAVRQEALKKLLRCGNEDDAVHRAIAAGKIREAMAARGTAAERDFTPVTIPVHMHVINKGQGEINGDVPDAQLQAQIDHLNRTYAGTGFNFRLASLDRTTNPDWYHLKNAEDFDAMRSALHKGGIDELNVFINRPGSDDPTQMGFLGVSSLPWLVQSAPETDGVMLNNLTLPGGLAKNYNEGDTATHEVGHWLGLWHTFGMGCGGPGDEISDTPAQGEPTIGSPEHADTCPAQPGEDPIHNFMDYSDDPLMNEFTPEQVARMQQHWEIFRRGGGGPLAAVSKSDEVEVKDGQKISSTVSFDQDVPFESLKFDLSAAGMNTEGEDWMHPSPQDLVVTLKSPSGKEVVLFDHVEDFQPAFVSIDVASLFPGEPTKGDWTLSVEDTVQNGKDGKLYFWSLTAGAPQA